MTPLIDEALEYHDRGWCVIPMNLSSGKKRPARKWSPYQTVRPTEADLRKWFSGTRKGMGVVYGAISGNLASRDFDTMNSYDRWATSYPDLAKSLPTVATRRGRHVYCRADQKALRRLRESLGKPDGRGAINCGDGELRAGVGCYSIIPSSQLPSGFQYQWLIPPNDFPILDPVETGLYSWGVKETERHRGEQRRTEAIEALCVGGVCCVSVAGELPWTPQIESALLTTLPKQPGQRHKQVFEFARALKAIPELTDASVKDLKPYVVLWHSLAKPVIGTKPFEETWIDFFQAWPRIKFPKGTEPMLDVLAIAAATPMPAVAMQYDQENCRLLVALCRELQRRAKSGPFYLSCRTAGRLLNVSHKIAWRWLCMLEVDDVLFVVCLGGNKTQKATRYRYLAEL